VKRVNALILLFIFLKSTVGFCAIGMPCCDEEMEISCCAVADDLTESTSDLPEDNSNNTEKNCSNNCCTINASVFILDGYILTSRTIDMIYAQNPDYATRWLKLETTQKIFQPPRIV
jgi:hypothetical protein